MTATPASDALRADHRGVEMCLDRLLFAAKHPITDLARRVREGFLEIRRLARPHFHKEENVCYRYLRVWLDDVLTQMRRSTWHIHEVGSGTWMTC